MTIDNQSKTHTKNLSEVAGKLFPTLIGDQDESFFQTLIEEYSDTLDVERQIKLFHAWCLDQQPSQIKNPRFRFRSWLENAAEYNSRRKVRTTPSLYSKQKNPSTENKAAEVTKL